MVCEKQHRKDIMIIKVSQKEGENFSKNKSQEVTNCLTIAGIFRFRGIFFEIYALLPVAFCSTATGTWAPGIATACSQYMFDGDFFGCMTTISVQTTGIAISTNQFQ